MIIDMDGHVMEGYVLDEVYQLEELWAHLSPKRVGQTRGYDSLFTNFLGSPEKRGPHDTRNEVLYDPKRNPELAQWQVGGYDMKVRLQHLALEGIDVQLLFPSPGVGGMPGATQPGEIGAALCRAYNNWISRLVTGYEDRLLPVAYVPFGCPEQTVAELRRCVHNLGMRAAHLVTRCGEHRLDDPYFYPYYEAVQELNIPLMCHGGTPGPKTDNYFLQHVTGRPNDTAQALTALVCGGVFERFPALRVNFLELGAEWLMYWLHRMDEDAEHLQKDFAPYLTMRPSAYIRRNCWVNCEADEPLLPIALQALGEAHVCFGSDYPHFDSAFPNTVKILRGREDRTERQKKLILEENPKQLLNL